MVRAGRIKAPKNRVTERLIRIHATNHTLIRPVKRDSAKESRNLKELASRQTPHDTDFKDQHDAQASRNLRADLVAGFHGRRLGGGLRRRTETARRAAGLQGDAADLRL